MSGPSEKTVKKLFALSKNQCGFPNCGTPIVHSTGTIVGDICHIKAQSPGGPRFDSGQTEDQRHAFENLLLLCNLHHRLIDADPEKYSVELLNEIKELHERDGSIELSLESARMARKLFDQTNVHIQADGHSQVMVGSPGAIQTHQFIYKATKKNAPSILPTQGAIGHDLAKRNYILHLIERYKDFQKWDTSKQGVGKYVVINNSIKREFGAKWDLVPEQRFQELANYLQGRILNSKLGRIKNSRGEKCFSNWEEWILKKNSGPV